MQVQFGNKSNNFKKYVAKIENVGEDEYFVSFFKSVSENRTTFTHDPDNNSYAPPDDIVEIIKVKHTIN